MANLLSDADVFGSAPSGLLSDADVFGKGAKTEPGGFVASAKQALGAGIKGAGQAAADFIPGVSQENALKRYGQEIIEANPTAVHSFSDLADKPWTAVKEATGNALSSMGGVVGARALGTGITAAAPLAGPAAPIVAGAGQAISWLGPVAAAALPSFGGIREQQIHDDPNATNSAAAKAAAAVGAGTVGAIESRFGPEAWGSKMLTEAGRNEVAKLFAAKTLPQAIAKGAVRGAAVEGAEELAQNPVEQLAAFQNPLTAEALKDTAFSGAMGALGGGVLGGGTGAASRYLPKKPDPPKALPAPTYYTGTPGYQTLQATVDRQNAVDAAQAATDALYNERDAFERERAANMGGPTEPPSTPGGGIDFTPPQLPDTGPLSRAANISLVSSSSMERRALFPFASFDAAEMARRGRADLVSRPHPTVPGRFALVPSGMEAPRGTGSFADQSELANFIADERKDQSARRAAIAEWNNNAIAQADQAVSDARQFATRNERLSILDGVLSSLAPGQNPNRRFDAALKAAGFRDTSFTEEERTIIGRYGNAASAFAEAPTTPVEPSSPNEMGDIIPAAPGKGNPGIAGAKIDRVRSAIAAGFTQRKGFSLINPATGEKFALKTPGMIRAAKEALEKLSATNTENRSDENTSMATGGGEEQRPEQIGSQGNLPTVAVGVGPGDYPVAETSVPSGEPAVSVGDGSERNAALSEQKSTAKPRRTRMTPLDDPRISKHAESLQAMAGDVGWAETGGLLLRDANGKANGRTQWIPHAEWFRAGMIGRPDDATKAVQKAVSGEPMSVKEKRTIQGMMDWLDHVDAHPNEAEALADMGYDDLTEPEQEARDALGDFDPFNPPVGDVAAGMRALGFTEEEIRAEIEGSQSRDSGQGDGVDNGIAGRGPQESLPGRDETRPSASEGQGPDERPSLELERQTDQGLADKAAREQEPQEPTKEQADRERDAAPFSLSEQSQPKPQGVQSGLFTADGRVSVEAKQPEKPAEVTKPKNEQQEAAGLPAATDGGSRPVPAVSALEETFRPLIERLIRNKRVAKELGFDIDGAIAKAKAAMAGAKQMPGSFRALAKRAEKKGDTETAAILNQIADLNDGRKAKAALQSAGDKQADDNNAQSDATLSRTRSRSEVTFSEPYTGATGAKLVGYAWMHKKEEFVDHRGEDRVRTVSDWEQAADNLETGRQIVHLFFVQKQDGTEQEVSAETAADLLGISESAVRSNAKRRLEHEIAKAKKKVQEINEANAVDAVAAKDSPAKAVESMTVFGYSTNAPMVKRLADNGPGWFKIEDKIPRESAQNESYRFLERDGKFIWSSEFVKAGSELERRGWKTVELLASEVWPAPKIKTAIPEWHTKLPAEGMDIIPGDEKINGPTNVVIRAANDAYNAITQTQFMAGVPFYAYVKAAADGRHGIVRLLPDDQAVPAGWKLVNGEGLRIGGMTKEQIVQKLNGWLRREPIIGERAKHEEVKPANVELKKGDLIGASQEESDAIASKIEEKRRQLVEIEDRIVGAAGLAPGFIEDAMRSRKVPSSMKEQREAIRAELADMRKQHAAVTAADRLLASKGGLDEANAESKQTGAADSSDELDSAKIRAGYSHRSLGRLSDKVKMEQGWFVNAANEFAEKVGKDAESDEQKELADKLLAEFKAEYKTRRYRVMAVGETVVSSAVAGRNNFNSAQAGKRGSALDRAEQQFSDWQNDAIENGVRAIREARSPEQVAAEKQAKDEKAAKNKANLHGLLGKLMAFKKGDEVKFGLYPVARVTADKAGYPSSVTVEATDLTDNKFDIAKMLFGGDKSALKSAVDEIRAAQPAEAKPSESVPESLLDQHNATMAKLTDGTLSLDQYRAAFATIVENKDAVFAELSKLTKDAIFKRFRALFYRYKNDPKPEIIKAAYRSMMDDFVLSDSIQWSMGQKYEDVIRGYVDAATPESLAAYAEKLQAANAERERRREEIAKAIADPQTLEDYRRLLQAKVDGGKTVDQARMELTPEQRVAFDTLWAEDTRGRRSSAADARKTDVQVAARTTSGDIIETKHTKTGEDLFVVKAAERVERDVYNEWNASAKRLGGRYSSFRGNGAVPGFQFKSRENAVAFLQYLGGDVSAAKEAIQERRDAFADDRSQSAVERLNEMADRLEERADESLAVERKANTARRARFAASAEAAANGDKAMARTMRNIADAIADGTAKFLDRVRQKVQVEMLRSTVASAKYDELRQKYPSYVDQEKHRGEKPTAETADYARWPRFTADRADLARLGRDLLQIDGAKQLGNSILKVADDVTEAYKKFAKENLYKVSVFSVKREGSDEKQMAVFPTAERAEAVIARSGFKGKATTISFKRGEHLVIMGPEMAREAGLWHGDPDKRITLTPEAGEEIVAKVKALGKGKVAMPYVFENVANERARWKAIGIETAAEQRAALREFIALQEAPAAPDRIKQMEREMIGRKNDGLDFFPTPAATAQAMIEAADIKEGMSVLEPSAGMGHIAEQIRDVAGVEPDVIEFSGDRRELLEAKGFNVVGSDFMDMNSRGFTYGDVFRTPDGTLGVMRGSGGLGSNRVGLDPLDANGQPDPRRAIWTDRDELVGVEKRASNSGYDRIIMNPPFSNRRDAEHVQHAYSLLKPGGRLVAIMGEGVFYGQDKKAQAFRDWMESVGGTSEKLEEGTFLDPSLPVNTGVNARMVVIDKSGNGAPQALESRAPSFDSSDAPQTTLIRRVVDSFLAHFQGAAALDVRVVASRNEIPPRYRPSPYAEGVYHDADGVVYLISSNLPTQARAWQVLMHEAIGHYGLSNLMGEKFAALQSTVLQKATSGRELTRHPQPGEADYATVEAVRRLYPEASDSEVAQEVLARMAEMMDPPGWSKILFAQVRHWLRTAARAMNLTVEPSLQEAKDAVVLAAKHLRDGKNLEREMAGEGQAFASEGAPRLAPNGKPSRLNAHQWKQVRTPEFKAWFGDWEASAILNGEPLASMKTADAPSGGFKAVEDWAASLFAEQGGVAVREGLGEVLLDRRAAKTSMAHGGANQYEKVAFAAVKDVIERGALVHRTANGDVDSFYFSAPVDIDGVTNIETVLVHRDANTGRMYLHSVMAKESLLNHQVSRADAGASERSGSTDSEGISRILQDLVRRNGVSKVVDENGEPLVVYHGTDADIYAFSQSFLGHTTGAKSAKAGFFFASNPETADYYPQYDKETVLDAYGFMRKKGETTEEYRRRMESPEGTPSGRLESAMHKYRATVPPAIAALNLSGRLASSPKSQLDAYLLHGDPSRFAGQFRSSEIGDELEAAGFFDAQDDKSPQEAMELFEAEVARRVRAEGETAIALKIDALDQDGRQALEAARAAAVVYRMAKKESDEFNFRYQWSKKSWAGGDQDGEVWEASKESQAPNIIPVFLAIKRPFIHDFKGKGYREVSYAELLEGAKVGDHDGATFLRTADPTPADIFVAFDPTQIKSAISNRGSFDGTNPNILESRSAGPVQWKAPEPSRLDDLIYSMQDKHVDMKRVVQSIKKTAGTISDNIDPYLQEELFHGRAAKAVKDFLDLELRPLIAEMRMRGVGMADFEEYLWNRHAEERNAQIAKINPQMPDGGSGLATADARAYLAGLSSDKRKAYESLAAKIDAITARNRQVLVDSGLEKAETVAAWEGAYKHYVPLQREDVETGGNGTGQGFSVRGTSSKRAVGSGRPVADIIANLAMQRERFIVKAEKNRVSIAIAGLAASNPNPDFWKLNEAPKERVVNNVALYNVLDANGNKVADFTRMDEAERMARSMGGEVEQTWGDRVQERIVPGFKNQENVVHFRLNGEDHFVVFNEREPRALRMAQSIKNLDMDQLGRVLTVAGKATRYFASINTQYNPIFGVINLFRDVQGALLNLSTTPLAGEQKRVAGYTVDALRGIYADIRAHRSGKVPSSRWASLYEEFQNEGGQTGYRDQFSNAEQRAEAIAKEIRSMDRNAAFKAAGAVFDWLSDYNQAMENAVRLAAYAAAKERGLSKQQAASLAKNLTVNFNRKGQVATQMGALYAFFNASMQGTARLAQTLTGPMGRRIITGGILLGSMQALLLASAGMGDDEPPEFVRERNLILPIGDGKYISLPMPLGFHVLPNLGRIPVEFVMSGFREPARRISDLVAIFADTFNPIGNAGLSLQTIAPTVVDPFAALAENKDWTGKPIAKMDMNANSPTPGHSRAKDTSTVWSKSIAEAINYLSGGTKYKPGVVSPTPDQIDYLIGQVTGGVGREAAKAEQTVTSTIFTGEELPLHKVPLVGRFVGDTKGQSAEGSKFYAALQRINEHENEIKGMRKDGRGAEIAGYIQDNPEARLMLYSNHVEREVQKLRAAKRDALERGDEGRVRMIESALTAKMRAFNERVRSAQGSAN